MRGLFICRLPGSEEIIAHVVGDSPQHQQHKQCHADDLRADHELLRQFAARHHLAYQEEGVAAVQSRDGQDVHEGQDDADECGELPEALPVPLRGEHAADGAEAAHALGSVLCKDILEVVHIAAQHFYAVIDAGGEGFKEPEVDLACAVVAQHLSVGDAHLVVGVHGERYGVIGRRALVAHYEREAAKIHAVGVVGGGERVAGAALLEVDLIPRLYAAAVIGEDAVPRPHAGLHGGRRGDDAVHHRRDAGLDERRQRLDHREHVHVARERDRHPLAIAQDIGHGRVGQCPVDAAYTLVAVEAQKLLGVGAQQNVAVAEAELVRLLVELHAVGHVLDRRVGLAPSEENHGVDEEGHDKVDEDAREHDDKALPGGMRAKLPRLRGTLHLVGIHRLVYHAGYLHIAAQRQPAEGIGGLAVLGFELEEREPGIEEETELLYSHLEDLCGQKVSSLMQYDENGETEYQLQMYSPQSEQNAGSRSAGFSGFDLFLLFGVPPLLALLIVWAIASRNKTKGIAVSADAYATGHLNLTRRQDIFTHITRTVTHIPRNDDHGGTSVNSSGFSHSSGKF